MFAPLALALSLSMLAATAAGASPRPGSQDSARTGSLQATLTGGEWPNLDPALDTQDAADATMMDAIYGGLFEFLPNGKNTKVIPDEATGYKFSNGGLSFELTLRHGLKFSNGDPMNASVVAASINRDLLPANACICGPSFSAVKSVTASGQYQVDFTLSHPFPALIYAFDATAPNWTADTDVLAKEGPTTFGQSPIAAGPFEVVSNQASSTLKLKANPNYWQPHHPLVQDLTFVSVGADQSAYNAILAGQAQVATTVTTIPVMEQAKKAGNVAVLLSPATGYNFVEMNSKVAPFNNIVAREAIAYATDPKAVVQGLYHNVYKVVESPTAPGETVYLPKVPGYRNYDLAKAKALVHQLGGLTVTLGGLTNTQYWENEQTALAQQWEQAGITVHIQVNTLQDYLKGLESGNWQALDTQWGTVDPALGLPTHFSSAAPLSGTKDPVVDTLMAKAAEAPRYSSRVALYTQLSRRLASNADDVFLYSKPVITLAAKNLKGAQAAANSFWENVG
jgi:ABC-type transport system substrate-binding protein